MRPFLHKPLWMLWIAGTSFSALALAQTAPMDPALIAKSNVGDVAAQIAVGDAYAQAPGRAQDCKLAADWYAKAAHQDNIAAQLHLATLYRDGCKTLPRDMAQAAVWYQKAAAQGDADAQATLGSLYSMGQGVARDYNEAYFWLDLAAHTPGAKQPQYTANRQLIGTHLTTDEVEAAKDRVESWRAAHPRNQK
jgi:TPR repeat protein